MVSWLPMPDTTWPDHNRRNCLCRRSGVMSAKKRATGQR